MSDRQLPLWLRKTANQLVAQWIARRVGTQFVEDKNGLRRVRITLLRELLWAIAERMPDQRLRGGLFALLNEERPDAR